MVMIMMIVNMVMVVKIFHHLVCFCLSQVSKSLNLISEGLKYPPEVRVVRKTCSTICGTPVQAILDQKQLTGLTGGGGEVRRSKYGPEWASLMALVPSSYLWITLAPFFDGRILSVFFLLSF